MAWHTSAGEGRAAKVVIIVCCFLQGWVCILHTGSDSGEICGNIQTSLCREEETQAGFDYHCFYHFFCVQLAQVGFCVQVGRVGLSVQLSKLGCCV